MQLQPNIVFDNHYTLTRLLGRGGFSEVWLAHDSYMDLDVALKIYAPGHGLDNTSIKEFRHEIKDVFNLSHPNLLTPKHLGICEKMPYLVLPYCQGGSVTQQLGKMSEQQIWKLIHDIASGLAYLHQKDIVHQDIKPDNILIDEAGNYVITDFGISAKARAALRKSTIVANEAVQGGTRAYMGPERFSKQPAPVKASDIWSFGAMVYELITGVVPFGEIGGWLQKNGADIPEITAPVSEELRQAVESMLALATWDRPTAEKLLEIQQKPKVEKVPEMPVDVTPWWRKKRLVVVVTIIICVIVGGILVAKWIGGGKGPGPGDPKIESEYKALKDSCNLHFKQQRYDDCRDDIDKMEQMEKSNPWLKPTFSKSYRNVLDSMEIKKQPKIK